jgi:hypothetical protein
MSASPPTDDERATLIAAMVNRFLAWRLPEHFRPDAGISFTPDYNQHTPWPAKHEPVGTNLFTADQAREMFEHCLPPLHSAIPPKEGQIEQDAARYRWLREHALPKLQNGPELRWLLPRDNLDLS